MSSNLITADNGVSSGVTGITQSAGSDGTLQLRTTTSGGTATTALTIDNSQKVTFANSIGFGSNAGITFNNSSALTNSTLNDYETGTYTVTDQSGAGLTFTSSVGIYTKIGNYVFVHIDLVFPSTSNAAAVKLSLPFTSRANPGNDGSTGSGSIAFSNQTTFSNAMSVYVPVNTSVAALYRQGTNGTQVSNVNLSTTELAVSVVYQANF